MKVWYKMDRFEKDQVIKLISMVIALLVACFPWILAEVFYQYSVHQITNRYTGESEGEAYILIFIGGVSLIITPVLVFMLSQMKGIPVKVCAMLSAMSCIAYQMMPFLSLSICYYARTPWLQSGRTSDLVCEVLLALPPTVLFSVIFVVSMKLKRKFGLLVTILLSLAYIPFGYFCFK